MIRFIAASVCMLMGLLATMAHATSPVGTTPGKFEVNDNGAATYTVPIQVPPGINGLEPKLALVYNSQQPTDGLVGVGWSLSGLSSISRCPGTIAVDGARSGISFSGSQYCWDGQRLIPKTTGSAQDTGTDDVGAYWEFRAEMETFARIRAYGSLTSPTQFRAWTKNGRVLSFGATDDSKVNPQGKGILIWALNREEDRTGNYLTVTYGTTRADGSPSNDAEYYPVSIEYGGANAGEVVTRSVEFGMDPTLRPDKIIKYVAGAELDTTNRLSTITTKFGSNTVRTYTLTYDQEGSTAQRTLLRSIQECGSDGTCYNNQLTFAAQGLGATTFTNGPPANGLISGTEFNQWNQLVDVNGDGIQDIFKITSPSNGTVQVLFGSISGSYAAGPTTSGVITNDASGFNKWNEIADVNGDGIMDIVRLIKPGGGSNADITIYLGNADGSFAKPGVTFANAATYGTEGFRFWNQVIDMNGDGLADIFRVIPGTSKFAVNYGYIESGAYKLKTCVDASCQIDGLAVSNSTFGFRQANQLADMDGDGIVDIFRVLIPSGGSDPNNAKNVNILFGRSVNDATIPGGKLVFVSLTADQVNIVSPIQFANAQYGGYFNYYNQLVDVNGDGIADIVHITGTTESHVGAGGYVQEAFVGCNRSTPPGFCQFKEFHLMKTSSSSTVDVLLGHGDGTFSPVIATPNIFDVSALTVKSTLVVNGSTGKVDATASNCQPVGFGPIIYPTNNTGDLLYGSYSAGDQINIWDCRNYDTTSSKGITHLHQFADIDGDGYVDIIRVSTSGQVSIAYGNGDGTFKSPTASLTTINVPNGFRATNQLADLNGDGIVDIFTVNGTTDTPKLLNRKRPGLMASITDGNGLVTSVTSYEPLSHSSAYAKSAGVEAYPLRKVEIPQYVVTASKVSASGFNYTYNYKYADAKVDLTRGWLGFASVTRTDNNTHLETTSSFNQPFPYTGRPSLKTVRSTNAAAGKYLSTTSYNDPGNSLGWADRTDTNTNSSGKVHFVYSIGNVRKTYEPSNNYSLVLTTTTSYLNNGGAGNYDATPFDQFGNPEEVQVVYSDNSTGHKIITAHVSTYSTTSPYLGQLSQQDTTVTHATPAGETKTRVTRNTYYPDGLLHTVVSQPDSGNADHDLSTTTEYVYDDNGRVHSLIITGSDPTYNAAGSIAASPSVGRSIIYDYAPESVTELGVTKTTAVSSSATLVETLTYDPRFGVQSGYTDPAGIQTQWGYDGFGRKVLEKDYSGSANPVSTITNFFAATDSANCPLVTGLKYCAKVTRSGISLPVIAEHDALGRELRTISHDAAGAPVYKDTQYDTAGRLSTVSRPYYSGTPPWTTTSYDLAGRPSSVTAPNGATTTYTYNGLTTTTTRAAGGEASQITATVKDSQGQTVKVIDALNNSTTYKYGPFGMLETITDANGNVITLGYDIFGNKLSQNDPDTGLWSYKYNAFGEIKWQKDAKAQATLFQYDYRGRMTGRTEADGTVTAWTYDTPTAGRLGSVVRGSGTVTQAYTYDAVTGQVKKATTTVNGASYDVQTDYDDFGRVQYLTYPGAALKIKYSYYTTNGALNTVINAANSDLYWSATKYNADGLPTEENWGNGLTGTREYDPETGALTAISTDPVQDLGYSYYRLGNLQTRSNNLTGVSETETLYYDALNRLGRVESTAGATQNFEYDALGNLTFKSGVGYYTYDSRPHAVTQLAPTRADLAGDANGNGTIDSGDITPIVNQALGIQTASGNPNCNGDLAVNVLDVLCVNNRIYNNSTVTNQPTVSYSYDANGNLTSGGGRAIGYTAFNMPATVDYAGQREVYAYGPDYARVSKQIANISNGAVTQTVTYLGKLYERINRSGTIEERFYISAGDRLVAEVSKSGSTSNIYYIHTDLLGSVETVTDKNKTVKDNLSFDAWGLPRQANWQDSPPTSAFDQTTRGYTGHETDVATGLVNMNARLYDPRLGRFLQADTVIPSTFNPQSLNKYSYAVNNPFVFIDPTGHEFVQASDGYSTFDGSPNGNTAVYVQGTGAFYFSDGSIITGNGGYVDSGSAAWGYNSSRDWGNCVGQECGSASDPSYKIIDPYNPAIYDVVIDDGYAMVIGAPAHLNGGHVAVNGQSNDPEKAVGLMATHVGADDRSFTQFSLVYNPTFETTYGSVVGGVLDTLESIALKAGFNTPTSDLIASELRYEQGVSLDWTVHSQGDLEFLQGASQAGVNLAGNNLWVHGGAGNNAYTAELASQTGFHVAEKNRCSPSDPVCNIAGENGSIGNILRSAVMIPCTLMCGSNMSPHTLPYQRPGEAEFRQYKTR